MGLIGWPFSKNNFKFAVLVVSFLLYLIFGASIFSVTEGRAERKTREEFIVFRNNFLLEKGSCISDAQLEEFIRKVEQANNRGVSALNNATAEPNWSFGQALFFAGTIVTTIGYGRVTPLSESGKAFCLLYALFGIPLTLLMFGAVVDRVLLASNKVLSFMVRKMQATYALLHIRLLHLFLIIIFVLIFVFLIPAAVFASIEEEWSYFDAFYYCFISMTTIGLGDYIPGDSPKQKLRPLYKTFTTIYLLVGLVFMLLMLRVVSGVPELNLDYQFSLPNDADEERKHLTSSGAGGAQNQPRYTKQRDENSSTTTGGGSADTPGGEHNKAAAGHDQDNNVSSSATE